MNLNNIKTEQQAIEWIGVYIPFAIKPKRKSKYKFVPCFTSHNAHSIVIESLGKHLFEQLTNISNNGMQL